MTDPTTERPYAEVLADAVRVLTEAARLTRPTMLQDDDTGEWAPSRRFTEPADWAEFVTLALAVAAANVGGVERALAGRPGSWEADGVRTLLRSTVGEDDAELWRHRTESVKVDLYVDELLVDHTSAWDQYEAAAVELTRRYDALGIPSAVSGDEETLAALTPATPEQEAAADDLAQLKDALEQQRDAEWAAYGAALAAHIEELARDVRGLDVGVEIEVDTVTSRTHRHDPWAEYPDLGETLLARAIEEVPSPADLDGTPLERLQAARDAGQS